MSLYGLYEVLRRVAAIGGCKITDILDLSELYNALAMGYVDCVGGRLSLTQDGTLQYLALRMARENG